MNKQRKFLLLAAVAGLVSTLLPWITLSAGAFGYNVSESQNGFHGIGVFYFLLLLSIVIIASMGNRAESLQKNMRLSVIGISTVSVVCLIIAYSNANESTSGTYGVASASIGFGIILAFLSSLATLAIPLLIKEEGDNLTSDLAHLKNNLRAMQENVASTTAAPSKPAKKEVVRLDELERLINWREEGKITAEEYQELKSKVL